MKFITDVWNKIDTDMTLAAQRFQKLKIDANRSVVNFNRKRIYW